MRTIQYIPRATEKAYAAQAQNTYMFYVPKSASKQEIAKRISEDFKVTVIDVRTMVRKGKPTRFSRGKHAYPGTTNRQDKKVAYITVKAGDKIPVFEEAEEEKATDAKEEKTDKKTAKKEAKEDKKAAKDSASKSKKKEEEK